MGQEGGLGQQGDDGLASMVEDWANGEQVWPTWGGMCQLGEEGLGNMDEDWANSRRIGPTRGRIGPRGRRRISAMGR